jgi:hypothetical protein
MCLPLHPNCFLSHLQMAFDSKMAAPLGVTRVGNLPLGLSCMPHRANKYKDVKDGWHVEWCMLEALTLAHDLTTTQHNWIPAMCNNPAPLPRQKAFFSCLSVTPVSN